MFRSGRFHHHRKKCPLYNGERNEFEMYVVIWVKRFCKLHEDYASIGSATRDRNCLAGMHTFFPHRQLKFVSRPRIWGPCSYACTSTAEKQLHSFPSLSWHLTNEFYDGDMIKFLKQIVYPEILLMKMMEYYYMQ